MQEFLMMGVVAFVILIALILLASWVIVTLVNSVVRFSEARERESYAYSRWVDYKIGRVRDNGDE